MKRVPSGLAEDVNVMLSEGEATGLVKETGRRAKEVPVFGARRESLYWPSTWTRPLHDLLGEAEEGHDRDGGKTGGVG